KGNCNLFELVDDVVNVVADHEQGGNCGDDFGDSDQRLNLVDFGNDCLLSVLVIIKGIVQKDLIFLVFCKPGAIQEHNRHDQDRETPYGPHDRSKRHKHTSSEFSPSYRQDPGIPEGLLDPGVCTAEIIAL